MTIPLRSERELIALVKAGRILSRIMRKLKQALKPGITTKSLDTLAQRLIAEEGVESAFLGYRGYPATACISVNEEIVHGIPGERIINPGDAVSIDVGIKLEGYYADCAVTEIAGKADDRVKKLVEVARKALDIGIKKARPGNHLSDISHAIQSFVENNGFSVVRAFVGHGIGENLHEDPEVPNFGKPHCGPILEPGMVLAIEPMVNMGTYESKILENGWTAVTKDGLYSAHFEHTVALTRRGPRILT